MSSALGMEFGSQHQGVYAKLLKKWQIKLEDVDKLSPALELQWKTELEAALAEALNESLLSDVTLKQWDDATLPSKETLQNYAKIALKYALVFASVDLIRRYARSVKLNKETPPEDVSGALKFYRPTELIARAGQTVAQIFDMAKDQFNAVLNRFLQRKQELTGRKRWVTVGDGSRHASLHHQIRDEGGTFTYRRKQVLGPRPVGGSPYDWSNCSCYLTYERKDGKWVRVTD